MFAFIIYFLDLHNKTKTLMKTLAKILYAILAFAPIFALGYLLGLKLLN
jgi:uncharacterized membrane protein (Fun14 family)